MNPDVTGGPNPFEWEFFLERLLGHNRRGRSGWRRALAHDQVGGQLDPAPGRLAAFGALEQRAYCYRSHLR